MNLTQMDPEARKSLPYDHPALDDYAAQVEQKMGLPTGILRAIKNYGERSNSDQVSPKGAAGVMQIMPANFTDLGITDPSDPVQSIDGAGKHVAGLVKRLGTSVPTLAMAYNAGEGNLQKGNIGVGTKKYASSVAQAQAGYVPDHDMPDDGADPSGGMVINISGVAPSVVPDHDLPDFASQANQIPGQVSKMPSVGPDPSSTGGTLQVGPFDTGVKTSPGVDRFLSGAGRGFQASVDGAKQLYHDYLGTPEQQQADKLNAGEADHLDKPLMSTLGGNLGNMASQMGQMAAIPGGGLGMLGRTLLGTGLFESAQPVLPDQSRTGNVLRGEAGGLLGLGAFKALSAGASSLGKTGLDSLNPEMRDLVQKAIDWKIPLSADQMTSNPVVKMLGSALDSTPGSGYVKNAADQSSAYMRKLVSTMGETGDNLVEALGNAKKNLGAKYDDIFARNDVKIDPSHIADMRAAANDHAGWDMSPNNAETASLHGKIDHVMAQMDPYGVMPGKTYQNIRSRLGELAQGDANPSLKTSIKSIQKTLDGAANDSITATDVPALNTLRRQYQAMKTLEKAAPVDVTAGVNANQVARAVKNNMKPNYVYGTGDQNLPDVAKVGATLMKDPDSANKTRQAFVKALMGAGEVATGALLGSHAGHGGGGILAPVVGGLGALAAGKVAGSAMTSNWMRSVMANGIPGLTALNRNVTGPLATGGLGLAGQLGAPFAGSSAGDMSGR